MMLVPVTTSRDEFLTLLACDLSLMQTDGAGALELARRVEERVRQTYGIKPEDVSAWLDRDTNVMQIRYRYPARPEFIRVHFTIKENTMFEVNDSDWDGAPAGTVRAVPTGAPSTVRFQVFDGEQWRQAGNATTLFAADAADVTADPQVAPSA